MNTEKLMLIDGNSILNRAFYGLQGPKLLSTSDGLYTNAVFGFINILYKYMNEENPQYICVAFDLRAPTFRHKEFDGYKAKRKGMPPELVVQVPVIKQVLDAMNINRVEVEGFEADDIIGSVSLWAEDRGFDVIVITGDRDSLQLASDTTRIKIPVTKAGKTQTEEYNSDKMIEKYGVSPLQFIDVKALMGDKSDNIPGVPGIGEKTALDLIKKFENIQNLYDNLDMLDRKSVKEKLEANRDLAFMSKRLATIERHMEEKWDIDDLRIKEFDREKLYELFKRLEFKNLIEKLQLERSTPLIDIQKYVECIDDIEKLKKLKGTLISAKELALYYVIDEIDNFTGSLAGLALSWDKDRSVYISSGTGLNEEELLNELKDILEDENIKKYSHDVKNFILYLRRKGIKFKGLAFDTMIGAYIINPSRDTYTISELAGEYLQKGIESVEQMAGKGKNHVLYRDMPVEKLSSAAGVSAEVIFSVSGALDKIIKENNQEQLYYNIELPLINVLAEMEYWGFKVNQDGLKSFSSELELKINVLIDEIYSLAGEEFNINSTKQLGTILFDKLNLPVLKKTKTGYSTNAEVLEQLADKHEVVSKILEYRQLVKLRSTYVEGLINVISSATGKIHSNFNQTVTVTGRISSTEPNLQNIPIKIELGRKIRRVFVPESEDFILLDADYSQIELRVLAHITCDLNLISAFKNNEDIHTSTASQVFGIPKENVTSLMRSRAKAVNFGIVYGIGDFSLSKDLGITRKEARKYIDEYLNKFPNVRQYMHDIVEQGKKDGYVTTLFNRRRYLPELKSSNFNIRSFGERIAMNTPIQGSAADIIKIAMVRVYKELTSRNLKSRLILQVHDELIIETYKEEKEEVAKILKDSMENAVALNVPLSVDVKEGNSWYETK